ncbi:hypothetical protein [Macrococcus animalis]|uniref:hypothetical protein n=1 Tax=Macrococcus animalis TaxID=3395467 RepID=UPI0039BE1519
MPESIVLKRGISGYHRIDDELPVIDEKQFTSSCYALANLVNGRFVSIDTTLLGKNFYFTHIKIGEEDIYVLLNSIYPMISFARKVDYFDVEFIDSKKYTQYFQTNYLVLTLQELNASLLDVEHQLDQFELNQIDYFNSKRVGDVIYNFWD